MDPTTGIFDPSLPITTASGEVNFEYPDRPAILPSPISTMARPAASARDADVYIAATASRPLNFFSLPHDVLRKIYAMVLGPPTQVVIRSLEQLPEVQYPIVSPINLFLVSRKVHREAAAVLYGGTTFHMFSESAIGYMTGRMGLENCREIRNFVVLMQLAGNIKLTVRSVFPQLETLNITPMKDWYFGPWYELVHTRYNGYVERAIDEALTTSWDTANYGLKELAEMSRYYAVSMTLPFWCDADKSHPPVALQLTMKYPTWEVIC